jgi:antibiotic biosynthesis monooxygenase (ABM) superfamily enzyme
MKTNSVVAVVGTGISPESEEEWNTWYSEKHVPDVLKFRGVKKATRYKLTNLVVDEEGEFPKYLTIYEFENRHAAEAYLASPECQVVSEDWDKNWVKRGAELKFRAYYEVIKSWEQ